MPSTDDDDSQVQPSVYNGGNGPCMDEDDAKWVSTFVGSSIAEGSLIQGFVACISYIDPEGNPCWKMYNSLDAPMAQLVGLFEMGKNEIMTDYEDRRRNR